MGNEFSQAIFPLHDLLEGKEKSFSAKMPVSVLEFDDSELVFEGEIAIKGKIFIVDDELIMNFSAKTNFRLPCKVCNEPVTQELSIENQYFNEAVSELKGDTFSIIEPVREALVVAAPDYVECAGGACPEREFVEKYLHKERNGDEKSEMGYHPFSSL